MLNTEPETRLRPMRTRLAGIAVGFAMMGAAAGLEISSRAAPFYLVIVLIAVLAAFGVPRIGLALRRARLPLLLPLGLLIGYATISAFWALKPIAAIEKAAIAVAVVAVTTVIIVAIADRDRVERLHIAEGMWLGLSIGIAYTLFETWTGQAIVRTVVNALGVAPGTMRPPAFYTFKDGVLVAVDRNAMSRNIAPLTLLLWPALMAIRGYVAPRLAAALMTLVLVATSAAVLTSPHETSKLALVAGLIAWLATRYVPRIGSSAVRAGWVAACILPIPISIGLYEAGLHKMKSLQYSARHRVEIWNHSARETLAAPFFGNGAMTTYTSLEEAPPEKRSRLTPPHQHNVFLQVWQELGMVGAALLLLLGWRFIDLVGKLTPRLRPYAYAFMASAAAVASSSYGIWQIWFMALYGHAALAFAIGVAAHREVAEQDALPAAEPLPTSSAG